MRRSAACPASRRDVDAGAPVLVERAWRFDPPGRTVTQASASPGVATPSTRWIFPGGGRPRAASRRRSCVANPYVTRSDPRRIALLTMQDERRAGARRHPAGRARGSRRAGSTASPAPAPPWSSCRATASPGDRRARILAARRPTGPWRAGDAGATGARSPAWALPDVDTAIADVVITNVSACAGARGCCSSTRPNAFGRTLCTTIDIPAAGVGRSRLPIPTVVACASTARLRVIEPADRAVRRSADIVVAAWRACGASACVDPWDSRRAAPLPAVRRDSPGRRGCDGGARILRQFADRCRQGAVAAGACGLRLRPASSSPS